MASRSFFDLLKDAVNQIVSGEEVKEDSGPQKQRKKAAQTDMENAVIILATEVMRLGNTSDETEKILLTFLEKSFGKTQPKRSKQIADHLFVGPQAFTRMACEQLKSLATHDSRFEIIKLLYNIASVDDFVNAKEHSTIQKIAKYLNVSLDELRSIKEQYTRINNPFSMLEIEEVYTVAEVKRAYRKMVLKYHPDKRADGADEAEANGKFREIKKAYELLLKQLKD